MVGGGPHGVGVLRSVPIFTWLFPWPRRDWLVSISFHRLLTVLLWWLQFLSNIIFFSSPLAPIVLVQKPKPQLGHAVLQDFLSEAAGRVEHSDVGGGSAVALSPAAVTTPGQGQRVCAPPTGELGGASALS